MSPYTVVTLLQTLFFPCYTKQIFQITDFRVLAWYICWQICHQICNFKTCFQITVFSWFVLCHCFDKNE